MAVVDDESFDQIAQFNWSFDGNYAVRRLSLPGPKYKKIYMHRLLMGGACDGLEVDHINGKMKHLGMFETPEQASAAYKDAAKLMHGEFAFLGTN